MVAMNAMLRVQAPRSASQGTRAVTRAAAPISARPFVAPSPAPGRSFALRRAQASSGSSQNTAPEASPVVPIADQQQQQGNYYAPPEGYQQQQYTQQYQQAVPQYPMPPPVYQPAPKSGTPAWVWIAVGAVVAIVGGKVFEMIRGGPQMMQEKASQMMMEQMMKQMGGGAAGAGGMPGMGGMGGMPGMGGMGGMPGFPPPGAATPPPAWGSPAVDVKPEPTAAPAAAPASEAKPATETEKAGTEAKEGSVEDKKSSSKSFFQDYDQQAAAQEVKAEPVMDGAAAGAAGAGAGSGTVDMLEQMMRDPEMQKTLYPYLPEPMRNPETMEWMLSQPQYRAQMEQMMSQMQGGAGGMPGMPGGMPAGGMPDLDSPEVKAQFDQLGMSPQEVVSKILADPELATAFQNPKVQQAIMELSSNPMAMMKYQDDPEIMGLMTKIATVFPQAGAMPPGMGMPPQQ